MKFSFSCRPNRSELPDDLKGTVERVEKFRKVVQLLEKKILPQGVIGQRDENTREKRKKKIYEFTFATAIEELEKDLGESSLKTALNHCCEYFLMMRLVMSNGVNNFLSCFVFSVCDKKCC